jgi:sugar phosphate isomerase/epimerase
MRFGISTHLYHDERLSSRHLEEVAAHGFESIELFATRSHFDYHDEARIADLERWLKQTGLVLDGIHAPVMESYDRGQWGRAFSIASADSAEREEAVRETARVLDIVRRVPAGVLVVHVGLPRAHAAAGRDTRDAARRSLEVFAGIAAPLGLRVALEVIPNQLSSAASLVRLLEDETELPGAGICMDAGHAFLMGDLTDAIETSSGHVITTHVHDNHGARDEHLVPFDGGIDWPAAMTALQKIGYEETLMFEVGATAPSSEVLARTRRARERLEQLMIVQPLDLEAEPRT